MMALTAKKAEAERPTKQRWWSKKSNVIFRQGTPEEKENATMKPKQVYVARSTAQSATLSTWAKKRERRA